jgi:large conductance mechanosensitive channel
MATDNSMKTLVRDFRNFIMRGNVLDLAVAVIIGAAFNAVVQSLVKNVILRLVGAIAGKPDFSSLYFTINKSQIAYGQFITDVLNFLIIAASVFLIVRVFTTLQDRRRKGQIDPEDGPAPTDEALLLAEIRDVLVAQSGRPVPPPPATTA